MRMYDIIKAKRDGFSLTEKEIDFIINGYLNGDIPDYQMSALLMAIYFKGMTSSETSMLTMAMARSGDTVDLSEIDGITVDKHSTGGVGDKTTLILVPIVAACGVNVAKMSGRGLGHTGGTVDKLESIPGFRTSLNRQEFIDTVKKCGACVVGQSGNLAPADKALYALRDVTATVDSIPLIAASIMSKKIAAGCDCILLDVKVGSGAFMTKIEDARKLAEKMIEIGKKAGKKTVAVITNMDEPLGYAIGNSLEVIEAVNTLKGTGPCDLTELCLRLAAEMLCLAQKGSYEECLKMAKDSLYSGRALDKLVEMVTLQGGDPTVILNTNNLKKARFFHTVTAERSGYITHIDTECCGKASVLLGAGRQTKDSVIDHTAGIVLSSKVGDIVNKGDIIATLYADDESLFPLAEDTLLSSVEIGSEKPEPMKIIMSETLR
ncbi:MAG: pyrimidine-nucleoside phosphorylase [Clostridiales bacterium]|nr:pyrimidine-nucleoside phosphorylase [Clostridiales bacterium]